ncbi:MAG: isoleucine--tRNA ligase [Candidatus Heimdallarchaeota archaeon]|nr:isoleucine--tRNA ligase [Candidatus Heimdallarchaeota archaeon]MBY8995279.1 isoleucine--tRNA ligase [Candidatus Heimdallarchaeota archaeon]
MQKLENEQNKQLFPEVTSSLDLITLELEVLEFWEKNKVFEKLVEQNSKSTKHYSFIDGPITANNPMGLHHAWGRSIKDLIQRYWAMKGYEQRFQNGFDCQGLWVEVEVEKDLGLNSKKAIEEYGLENFSNKCKERIDHYSKLITKQSKRLGQFMDWDNSYFTHTDTNISYIWYFLKKCHEKGWIIKGNFPMPWCTRCGTSLSQHEQHDSYKEMLHTAVFTKFPLESQLEKDHEKSFLLVWTTTPWTLTANTAVAVHPDLTYCKVLKDNEILYVVESKLSLLKDNYEVLDTFPGKELVGLKYESPFGYLTAQKDVKHRVIEWVEVSGEEGTGFVHIAPGCGAEDFELSKIHKLSTISPIDDYGIFLEEFDEFQGLFVTETSEKVVESLRKRNLLLKTEEFTHRYPTCWRCHEELVFRLVQEWFIDSEEIRPLLKEATTKVEWVPSFYGKRMIDWLNNMGNWCISRKRYWGLPLPFFECKSCGELTVIGTKEELLEKAVDGADNLQELHRPWIDKVKIKCPKCNKVVPKVTEVGDCWLDAGIVPFSTMKYLEDPEYWLKWFPTEAVCEMREQIRLWFYSLLFMSITLKGVPPYKRVVVHEKVHDKDGRAMHRSWGNAIWFAEAADKVGAEIIRWGSAKQQLSQTMNFGYHFEDELKPFFLTVWNVYSFFATFANLDQFKPDKKQTTTLKTKPYLDKWLLSKLTELIRQVRKNLDKMDFKNAALEIEQFVEQLSTWYLRRSRRRFWKHEDSDEKISGYLTLYETLLTLSKLLAPFVPFFSERLYQNLTKFANSDMPMSVHLCAYPKFTKSQYDKELNEKMVVVLDVVKLGRSARSASNFRLRQPLSEVVVWSKDKKLESVLKEFKNEIQTELNVKKLRFAKNPEKLLEFKLKLNYQVLGPKLRNQIGLLEGKIQDIDQKLVINAYYEKDQVLEVEIDPKKKPLKLVLHEDLILDALPLGERTIAVSEHFAVAIDTKITENLLQEGFARDLVRHIQNLRKTEGLKVTDKITTSYKTKEKLAEAITKYSDYICAETLTTKLLQKEKLTKGEKLVIQGEELILTISKNK